MSRSSRSSRTVAVSMEDEEADQAVTSPPTARRLVLLVDHMAIAKRGPIQTDLSCSVITAKTLATRLMFALSHDVASILVLLVDSVHRVQGFRPVAVMLVLYLSLGRETLPLVSCQRGANRVKEGGGLGTAQCY